MPVTAVAPARVTDGPGPGALDVPGRRGRRRLGPSWPLTVLVVGFPLWWLMGLGEIMPLIVAVPMAVHLLRRRHEIAVPRGFGWWLLYLAWVCASGFMLWVDAPGAVPGGEPTRALVYAYRLVWCLACTIVLLWIGNADARAVPAARVVRLLGWMFVVTVLGGLLGVLAPQFELTSLVESLLPRGLRSNSFVRSLVHPQAATYASILGNGEYRPIAPFAFANSWGANLSLYLPFFLISGFAVRSARRRGLVVLVLLAAMVPVVYSMNRGLWAALAVGLLLLVARSALRGNVSVVVGSMIAAVLAGLLFAASPLAEVFLERLDNPHSNDRRSQLLTQTVVSTLEGSPVAGFGSTRDVQGSFASIAGGATPDCPGCGVPPLGTQGHLWLVIFSQGFLGALFFLSFFLSRARAHWRSRTALETAGMVVLVFLALEMFIYDTLGLPLFTVMIAIGLMWREREAVEPSPRAGTLFTLLRARLARPRLLVVLVLIGLGVGAAVAASAPARHSAQVSLLLAEAPLYLDEKTGTPDESGNTTIDTEAALVLSEETLQRLSAGRDDLDTSTLRDDIRITAPPNTRVLTISYVAPTPDAASAVVSALADAYLTTREDYLAQRRDQVLLSLREQLAEIRGSSGPGGSGEESVLVEEQVRAAIDSLTMTSTDAGEIIRTATVSRVPTHPEVPVVSGALIGFLIGLVLVWVAPPRPGPVRRSTDDLMTEPAAMRPEEER